MGDSQLDKGLRAVAWALLAATVGALIGVGVAFSPPTSPSNDTNTNAEWLSAATPGPSLEETE
ncbi:hypothetical protein [Vulgatibacter incomptus]|uniref:Uncharacterized protein n=1 Tax=Vulgatibacter incomptus TaxID=1391653 RepID=A0A0K1PCR0_9BACT|nr:hypothetical protein [Vulgatibacter incomptus]AKU91323.1 hypothetical protein AKJ08_1710 [Vulgatibacter incomptus]